MNTSLHHPDTGRARRSLALAMALVVASLCSTVGAGAWAQTTSRSVLDKSGTVYRALVGTEGELFRVGTGLGDRRILALDISGADGETDRLIVPSSLDALEATSPELVYLAAADSVYLLWESRLSTIHSRFNLVSFHRDTGWSDVSELSGRPFSRKLQPTVVPYSDSYPTGEEASRTRAFVQVIWRDETGGLWFVPSVVSDDAGALASSAATDLAALFQLSTGEGDYGLTVTPSVHRGETWLARLDRLTGTIDVVQTYVVPGLLSQVAEDLYATISQMHADVTLAEVRGHARATIVNIGRAIDPALAEVLAAEVDGRLGTMQAHLDSDDIETVAGDARATIVNIGARIDRAGIATAPEAEIQRSLLRLVEPTTGGVRPHHALLTHHSSIATPSDFSLDGASLLMARDGHALLLYEIGAESARYIVHSDGEWEPTRELHFDGDTASAETVPLLLAELLNQ